MGGLLSIHAAIEEKVDGFISIASALKFSDWRMRWGGPMSRFVCPLARVFGLGTISNNVTQYNQSIVYSEFPIEAARQLYLVYRKIVKNCYKLTCPLLIFHSLDDTVIQPSAASLLYNNAGSELKSLHWTTGEHNFLSSPQPEHEVILDKISRFIQNPIDYFVDV